MPRDDKRIAADTVWVSGLGWLFADRVDEDAARLYFGVGIGGARDAELLLSDLAAFEQAVRAAIDLLLAERAERERQFPAQLEPRSTSERV